MTKNLKYAAILLSICAVCAFALGLTNHITAPVIVQQELDNKMSALTAVSNDWQIGEQTDIEDDASVSYYLPLRENETVVGYILGLKGAGYGGAFTLVGSYTLDGNLVAAKMLTDSETPGLGKKSEEPGYMDKFLGFGATAPIPTAKSMLSDDDAAAVSGASVTFTGVAKALLGGSAFIKSLGGAQ